MTKKLDRPNYTQIPNTLLGDIAPGNKIIPGLMAQLEGAELKVFLAVCRLTFGFHQNERRASLTMIEQMTGLSRQGVINAANKLKNDHKIIERSKDGGVTLWKVVVNSVDSPLVNSVDQGVNSVDQRSQLSLPRSKKETRKKPKKETIYRDKPKNPDYLDDILSHQGDQKGISNPADDFEAHFGYRDQALKTYHDLTGQWADVHVGKPAIVALAQEEGFDLGRWKSSITTARLAGVKRENIQCFIDTYRAGGDYRLLFKNGNGASDHDNHSTNPEPDSTGPYSQADIERQDEHLSSLKTHHRL